MSDRLDLRFIDVARRHWSRVAMVDTTGRQLTYGRALVASLLLARRIARRAEGDDKVGILLPASVAGALANIATTLAGKTAVNLNFTAGAELMAAAVEQCRVRTIVTSRRFLEKADIQPNDAMVFLEDWIAGGGAVEKAGALAMARLWPARGLTAARADSASGVERAAPELAAVIFSSGSTGVPKGVMLSHRNILANIDSLLQAFPLTPEDCFIGVLPFFHSFGMTGTLWLPLLVGCRIAYHPNPMDAKTVGELAAAHQATMLISTPTFCQSYLRRCSKEQFAHLKYAIVGAEKLRPPIAATFREQYGIDLLEGYGCTEMAPVIAVNRVPLCPTDLQAGIRPGSVGRPIPDVEAKIVDQATGKTLGPNQEGLLLVRGANQMEGYLDDADLTAEAIRDGWYVTGDVARIDEDGFIFITDRLSRFSKIGGEMVPHVKIEDTINAAIGEACAAVTSVPDEDRGERLVAFYANPHISPEELWQRLAGSDLPRLWLPRRDSLVAIDAIPTLGTGKVDLLELRRLALERFSSASASRPPAR
jgi:acyl-[acyl-carrier-protein]-phospholipid O-acyltransferase/long-chain-fatty-acid--[acyl-carrier-protein] ligase